MIVSICGAAGTGKSSTAKAVAALWPACVRVPTDYFLVPRDPDDTTYFEQALAYDWPQFDVATSGRIGEQRTTPDFDFDHFQRRSPSGGRPFTIQRILLTDGFYPHPKAHLRILLECSDHVRRHRVAERDRLWQTQVIARWSQLEATRARLQRDCNDWHLRLPATTPISTNATLIIDLIQQTINH